VLDFSKPHRRYNPLTQEWVLVSPQRTARPWQGQHEEVKPDERPTYDPACYLCPGNERAGGARNPDYEGTFVFDNDFAALRPNTPSERFNDTDLILAQGEPGICRVICFSPRHDLTISRMSIAELRGVVDTWVEQYQELAARPLINWVQIFENQGAMMGASNPHPHCQVWANADAPNELRKENESQLDHHTTRGRCLLCSYLALELRLRERIVCANEQFIAVVPFWATWPFETMIIGKGHLSALDELSSEERDQLADILKQVTTRYDNLFQATFPYTMGFHQRPTDGSPHPEWHLHAHFYPPLLRSATVRKFMVGYELLASPQRDLTAEEAAQKLRNLPEKHYFK
jgi:UDPglucose--hexose-1-phosphate uridylyltransferase